jgi:hypothetical protein
MPHSYGEAYPLGSQLPDPATYPSPEVLAERFQEVTHQLALAPKFDYFAAEMCIDALGYMYHQRPIDLLPPRGAVNGNRYMIAKTEEPQDDETDQVLREMSEMLPYRGFRELLYVDSEELRNLRGIVGIFSLAHDDRIIDDALYDQLSPETRRVSMRAPLASKAYLDALGLAADYQDSMSVAPGGMSASELDGFWLQVMSRHVREAGDDVSLARLKQFDSKLFADLPDPSGVKYNEEGIRAVLREVGLSSGPVLREVYQKAPSYIDKRLVLSPWLGALLVADKEQSFSRRQSLMERVKLFSWNRGQSYQSPEAY